ncbi:MAG: hypothetical protein K0A98_08635, partial [Trueperaceae bacterium]|nr:hypothetical protein [Trueperaceae bacterium]
MPGPHRLHPAAVMLVGLTLLLAACDVAGLLEVDLTGQLLDADGAAVAGAVVFVPEGGGSSLLSTSATAAGCQAPSEDFVARTCTDAQGRYTLSVSAPAIGSLKLVFENLYWRAERTIDLGLRVPGEPIAVDPVEFPPFETGGKELEAAVRYALPSISSFQLITLNTENAVLALQEHAGSSGAGQIP